MSSATFYYGKKNDLFFSKTVVYPYFKAKVFKYKTIFIDHKHLINIQDVISLIKILLYKRIEKKTFYC